LLQLAELCLRHNLVICSDEIHCQLILDQDKQHIPIASLAPEIADRTITLMAPSKTYNLAGLYCSFAIIPNPQLRTRFERARAGIVPKVNALAYAATLAAYRDGDAWLAHLLAYLRANRDRLAEAATALPGISMTPVAATYLAWLDVRALELTDPKVFFENAGLGFNNGAEFGAPGFVRFNFGCTQATLTEAIRRLQKAIGSC